MGQLLCSHPRLSLYGRGTHTSPLPHSNQSLTRQVRLSPHASDLSLAPWQLWLDAASRFKFGSFIGSRLSRLLLHLPSLLLLLLLLWYSAIGDTVLGVYLTSVVGLLITAVLVTGFLVLGASIMIPVIQARAKLAKSGGNLDKAFAQAGYAVNAGESVPPDLIGG